MAVKLSKGRSALSVLAKDLKISPALLYRWRREQETKAGTGFPGKGKAQPIRRGQARGPPVKKRVAGHVAGARHLKKAVGIFSRGDGKYLGS